MIELISNNLQNIMFNFAHVARKSLDILINEYREFPIVPFPLFKLIAELSAQYPRVGIWFKK